MTHETTYGRIKLEVRIEYSPYISETERNEIINDIESFIKHRAGGCVDVRDINYKEPNFNIREGMGCWFIKDRLGNEVAVSK